MNDEAQFAVTVAKEAGEVLMKYFGTELTKKIKTGPEDFATEADEEAEKIILERLSHRYPQDAIIAEESGSHGSKQAKYTWIVDPLDGTHNFAAGSKDFGVMICRAKEGILDLAVVWNPAARALAVAKVSEGVTLNEVLVHLESESVKDLPLSVENDNQAQLKQIGYSVINLGASANTLITLAGKRGAFVSSNGFIWDFAPPALMLAEAGWRVTDFNGNSFRCDGKLEYGHPGIIAAKPDLHQELFTALQS